MELKYGGKIYKVEEPTIEMWSKLVLLQEWTDEREFSVKLLSFITGLSEEQIENADAFEVMEATTGLSEYLMRESKEFRNEFEFNGKRYKFLDLPNLTFGEFIDLDTYLSKPDVEKKKELNLFMSMLYRQLDDGGNYLPYNSKELMSRADEFKKLPVKYVNGATTFFLRLDKISQRGMMDSLSHRLMKKIKMIWSVGKWIVSTSIGVGLQQLSRLPKKILRK